MFSSFTWFQLFTLPCSRVEVQFMSISEWQASSHKSSSCLGQASSHWESVPSPAHANIVRPWKINNNKAFLSYDFNNVWLCVCVCACAPTCSEVLHGNTIRRQRWRICSIVGPRIPGAGRARPYQRQDSDELYKAPAFLFLSSLIWAAEKQMQPRQWRNVLSSWGTVCFLISS